ncbi:MAG TPA: Smr/MutS family protein [Thermoanaerobaculia bacterium]|nr:Smr/MutS family protein [Thermoanaerobaculia bacterium]
MDIQLKSLELDRVLSLIALNARTGLGRAVVMRRRPADSLAAAEQAQGKLAEMVRLYHRDGPLPFGGIVDVSAIFDSDSVLELSDSWIVLRAARGTQALREALTRGADPLPLLEEVATGIADLGEVISSVGRFFTSDGKLREEASAELRSIRSRTQARRAAIQKTLNDLMNRQADAIQEPLITLRGDRYCIPVRSDHRNAVPGILHERSGSGASMFIEPLPVVEMNNDLAELLIQEREEIARITRHIARLLLESADDIERSVEVASELDAIQACAVTYIDLECTRPRLSEGRELHLIDGRHPLLDQRLAGLRATAFGETDSGSVVPVTFELSDGRTALLVSGPNAGGKTVTLKTAGLLTAMAASGLPVPAAEGTVLPVVDGFHVLVGDDQDVLEHLSTFSAYISRLRKVLAEATPRSLVLLDELGSGTDPEEGSALAASVIEHLLSVGCLMIVTTHLSALKSFAITDERITNASMEFDAATGGPTFRMIVGVPGRSRAIEVAERMGLPRAVTDSARERLGDRYGAIDNLLANLQETLADVVGEREELRHARIEATRNLEQIRSEREQIQAERKKVSKSYRDEIVKLKDEVTRRLQMELRSLRESSAQKLDAGDAYERVVAPLSRLPELSPPSGPIRIGDRVEHRRFGMTGQVTAIDGTRARLSVGGKSVQAELEDLFPVEGTSTEKKKQKRAVASSSAEASESSEPQISSELNLIGQRVDDALDESDRFLDRSLMEGRGAVRLIHGFGTGALRTALREHLRKHPAVRSWRKGNEREGGDGATIALLDI